MRRKYIWDRETQSFVELKKRPKGQYHYVIEDTMDAVAHPVTGKLMDSKSEFRKVTRAAGCVEVGNEPMEDRRSYDSGGLRETLKGFFE